MSTVGTLRERVTIFGLAVASATPDGFPVETRPTLASSIPARMDHKRASEFTRAMRESVETRMVCTIRYRTGLDGASRVTWRGRTFDVEGIGNPDERRQFMALELKEIMP